MGVRTVWNVCGVPAQGEGMTRRRAMAGASAAGLGAVLLAACSGLGESGGGGSTPALKTGVTLRMMQYGTAPEAVTKAEVFRQFEAKYPGLKAELDNNTGGGELVNKDATECLLHEPAAVSALQLLQDLRTKYRFMPAAADAQAGATFPQGRVAMIESGPFNVGNLRRDAKDFTWDSGPMPRGTTGKYAATGGGAGQGVAAGTRNQEEAWTLLKHVMSPDALMTEIVKEHLNMPARKSLANSKEYLQSGLPPKNMKAFVEGLNYLRVPAGRPAGDQLGRDQRGHGAGDRAAVQRREGAPRRGVLDQARRGPAPGSG